LQIYVKALCTGTLFKPATHKARLEGRSLEELPSLCNTVNDY
jgi:hypothetical protein